MPAPRPANDAITCRSSDIENSLLIGSLRFGFDTAPARPSSPPVKRLVDTKSGGPRLKLISPGSHSPVLFRAWHRKRESRWAFSFAICSSSECQLCANRPHPPLTTVCPLPRTSNAACMRGTIEFHVEKLIRSQHFAGYTVSRGGSDADRHCSGMNPTSCAYRAPGFSVNRRFIVQLSWTNAQNVCVRSFGTQSGWPSL